MKSLFCQNLLSAICNFQVQGQLSLLCGGILTFGLTHYPYSEFELMAEELLMSDSIIKVLFPLKNWFKLYCLYYGFASKLLADISFCCHINGTISSGMLVFNFDVVRYVILEKIDIVSMTQCHVDTFQLELAKSKNLRELGK